MSVLHVCDYCGENIGDDRDEPMVTISLQGSLPDEKWPVNWWLGHYHSAPAVFGKPSCFQRVRDAMRLAESFGPTLEQIPVATGQSIAAKRRKHRKPGVDA